MENLESIKYINIRMHRPEHNIIRMQQHKSTVAADIVQIMQEAYRVEAQLLGVDDFPPLKRTVEDVQNSASSFYGYQKNATLAAVVEVTCNAGCLDIHSLIVSPSFFRQGLASDLLDFVLDCYDWMSARVETGRDNQPAIKLYQKKGFIIVKQWLTSTGIMKIGLQKLR